MKRVEIYTKTGTVLEGEILQGKGLLLYQWVMEPPPLTYKLTLYIKQFTISLQ